MTVQPGDLIDVRFNRPDTRRYPWWSGPPLRVVEVHESRFGSVVVAVDQWDDACVHVLMAGLDHEVRVHGEIEGQMSMFEGGA